MIRQGDLYWLDLGVPNGSEPDYRRPCVVIQNDVFNQSRLRTVVVCALTSNQKLGRSPGNVFLQKGMGGLTKDSVVNITHLQTVSDTVLEEKIGTLPLPIVRKIIEGINLLLRPMECYDE